MSDMKSKLPDLKELTSMTGKLFHDIKTSVTQIIHDYKEARAESATDIEEVKPAAEVPPKNTNASETSDIKEENK